MIRLCCITFTAQHLWYCFFQPYQCLWHSLLHSWNLFILYILWLFWSVYNPVGNSSINRYKPPWDTSTFFLYWGMMDTSDPLDIFIFVLNSFRILFFRFAFYWSIFSICSTSLHLCIFLISTNFFIYDHNFLLWTFFLFSI